MSIDNNCNCFKISIPGLMGSGGDTTAEDQLTSSDDGSVTGITILEGILKTDIPSNITDRYLVTLSKGDFRTFVYIRSSEDLPISYIQLYTEENPYDSDYVDLKLSLIDNYYLARGTYFLHIYDKSLNNKLISTKTLTVRNSPLLPISMQEEYQDTAFTRGLTGANSGLALARYLSDLKNIDQNKNYTKTECEKANTDYILSLSPSSYLDLENNTVNTFALFVYSINETGTVKLDNLLFTITKIDEKVQISLPEKRTITAAGTDLDFNVNLNCDISEDNETFFVKANSNQKCTLYSRYILNTINV